MKDGNTNKRMFKQTLNQPTAEDDLNKSAFDDQDEVDVSGGSSNKRRKLDDSGVKKGQNHSKSPPKPKKEKKQLTDEEIKKEEQKAAERFKLKKEEEIREKAGIFGKIITKCITESNNLDDGTKKWLVSLSDLGLSKISLEELKPYRDRYFRENMLEALKVGIAENKDEGGWDVLKDCTPTERLLLMQMLVKDHRAWVNENVFKWCEKFYNLVPFLKSYSEIQGDKHFSLILRRNAGICLKLDIQFTVPFLSYLIENQIAEDFIQPMIQQTGYQFSGSMKPNLGRPSNKVDNNNMKQNLIQVLRKNLGVDDRLANYFIESPVLFFRDNTFQFLFREIELMTALQICDLTNRYCVNSKQIDMTNIYRKLYELLKTDTVITNQLQKSGSNEKLEPSLFYQLIVNLKGCANPQVLLAQGLFKAASDEILMTKASSDKDIDFEKIQTIVEGNLTDTEKELYEKMKALTAPYFTKQDQRFFFSALQPKAAVQAIQLDKKFVGVKMLAGTGKTFTIFYVAWDYTNNSKEVVIVVPNDLLRRQMIADKNLYMPNQNVKVLRADEILIGQTTPNRVYLIDEADQVLTENMVTFKGEGANVQVAGLESVFGSSHKVIMFSATWKPYHLQLLKDVVQDPGQCELIIMQSPLQICHPNAQQCQFIEKEVRSGELVFEIGELVMQNYQTKPMIIFVESMEDEIYKEIKEITASVKVPVEFIKEETQALTARESIKTLSKGVIVIPIKFSRGLDVTFKIPAMVVVALTKAELTWTDLIQMGGRSNRKQGQGLCTLVFERDLLAIAESMQKVCQNREKVEELLGGENIKYLFTHVRKVDSKDYKVLKEIYGEGRWKCEHSLLLEKSATQLQKVFKIQSPFKKDSESSETKKKSQTS